MDALSLLWFASYVSDGWSFEFVSYVNDVRFLCVVCDFYVMYLCSCHVGPCAGVDSNYLIERLWMFWFFYCSLYQEDIISSCGRSVIS